MVAGPLPVGIAFAVVRPFSLMKARTMLSVDDPDVEYAIVRPLRSFKVLMGEEALTNQKSAAPVASAPIIRTGAPFENADIAPSVPTARPRSTLPEITGCSVSPEPEV